MPVSPELLKILCCPRSRTAVEALDGDRLDQLNEAIRSGTVLYQDGSAVDTPLEEGLVTVDGQTVYRVDGGIPVMLVDRAIPTGSVKGW